MQLFGHEIIAIMVGAVWGAGWGFLIVSAGQFFGELANYLCVQSPLPSIPFSMTDLLVRG